MHNLIIALIVAGVIALISVMTVEQEQKELDLYCEMVELRQTNPDLGWPDYKGIYEEVCK